ncbi:MAG TPA: NAD(P)-binding domain-containing protein, partial [Propionicimonas sp.]
MARFSIIGTGTMANAIGGLLADGGNDVTYVARDEVGATALGDVVVLALPYNAVDGVLAAYGDAFDGKVVVDITNPVNFETFDSLV